MKNVNGKIQKVKTPKYSIKDYQDDNVVFDAKTNELIEATIAVLKAIGEQEKSLNNGNALNLEFGF